MKKIKKPGGILSLKIGRTLCIAAVLLLFALRAKQLPSDFKSAVNICTKYSTLAVIPAKSEAEATLIVEKSSDNTESITNTDEQSTKKPSAEGSVKTTVTTTTAKTTTTKTTAAKSQEDINAKKYPIKEVKMADIGQSYNGIWVRNTNKNHTIDIKKELSLEPQIKIKKNADPQVLIIHTHTSECYQEEDRGYYLESDPSRTTDKSKNIVSVGDEIEAKLEAAGIKTIHATTFHDYPKYNGAYSRALETIKSYLEKYPSIEVVIDVHRDALGATGDTKTKPTVEINGKKAAQVMIISGCDDEGNLNFPDWEKNLRFAVRLQEAMNKRYPGLARPVAFSPFRYNMHMTYGSLLVEFGTDVNTHEEAVYSGKLFGDCLVDVLNTLTV